MLTHGKFSDVYVNFVLEGGRSGGVVATTRGHISQMLFASHASFRFKLETEIKRKDRSRDRL